MEQRRATRMELPSKPRGKAPTRQMNSHCLVEGSCTIEPPSPELRGSNSMELQSQWESPVQDNCAKLMRAIGPRGAMGWSCWVSQEKPYHQAKATYTKLPSHQEVQEGAIKQAGATGMELSSKPREATSQSQKVLSYWTKRSCTTKAKGGALSLLELTPMDMVTVFLCPYFQ